MIELNILGPAEIRNSKGELENSFLAGPKRLALLTFLLLHRPRGFHRRDSLLPLFWPEQDQKSARNSLSNMLYHIRKTLGKEALKSRGTEEIMMVPQAFSSDALFFEEAIGKQDYENALKVYRSDLLKGFFVSNISLEFDHWLEKERERFHTLARDACSNLADSFLQQNNYENAAKWLKKGIELDPDSEELHMKLMQSLHYDGNNKAALEVYENFSRYLQDEWNEVPKPEIRKFASNLSEETKKVPEPPRDPSNKTEDEASKNALAVLPFEDLSSRKLHFAEGIHGDILTALSRISDLHVISRTSVKNYPKTEKTSALIGRELNVTWLLEGEVEQAGKIIRINVRLVHAPNDSQVWSKMYQEKLTAENIFSIRDAVADDILETLKIRLSPREKTREVQHPTQNLEAYRLYTLGRSSLDLRTEDGIYRGLDLFKGSIELDPDYALAWSGLADAHSLLKYYGLPLPPNSLSPIFVASKAVELNPNLGEAHCSLGIAYSGEQNGPAAKREFEAAINLSPSYAEAYIWLGWINLMMGNATEALAVGEKSVKFNPLSPAFRIFLSIIYLGNKKYAEGLKEAQRAREINPDYSFTHFVEGLSLYHLDQFEEALFALKKTLPHALPLSTPSRAEVQTLMAFCYHALGNSEWGQNLKEEIHSRINPFPMAMLHALYDEKNAAFRSLENVQEWGSFSNEIIRYLFPKVFADLRKDERFTQLIGKINKAWGLEQEHE
ncbi:tetratricopeptide repeat protein [Salinimicrobium sp. HB62]|uniref:tetratricopeptide repeat protein n=1 Tax=Salinimicrobium sp. HB62 TaxID=3077781 RepID=UPI002D77AEF1|nr:tetratricopeptide repeat protein [Salinimicrobium sp. HB62]